MTEAGRDILNLMAVAKSTGGIVVAAALCAVLAGCGYVEQVVARANAPEARPAPVISGTDRQSDKRAAGQAKAIPKPAPKPPVQIPREKAEKIEKKETIETAALPIETDSDRKSTVHVARLDPKRLVGLDENQLRSMLGVPLIVRDQPPARIWNYRADSCSLDIFLYLDLASRHFRALTYDVTTTSKSGREDAIEVCVGRIYTEARG